MAIKFLDYLYIIYFNIICEFNNMIRDIISHLPQHEKLPI